MPKSFQQFPIFFIVFLQLLQLLKGYHWSGNTVYDLEYQGSSFNTEADAWTASSLLSSGVKTSTCLGNTILGGYNVLGGALATYLDQYWERYYSGLPTHNVIEFSLRFFPVDSWDGLAENDYFRLYFSGTILSLWRFDAYQSPYATANLCGNPIYEDLQPMWIYATVPHTADDLTFRVISDLLAGGSFDESVGFRELTMTFSQVTSPPGSASFCGVTPGYPLSNNACPCDPGTYMTPASTGNCANCDLTCATCNGGGSSACVTCPDGRFKSGSSCPACNSNCNTCSGSSTTCTSCPTGMFMVGTTCYSTCSSSLYSYGSSGVTYCATPCPGQYVYWDGSCGSTCSYGYNSLSFSVQPSVESTFSRCDYPCGSSQFLYWNNSCLPSCPDPLVTLSYKSRNFCAYPCGSTEYLAWNQSCLSTCPYPLTSETRGTYLARQFCWYTCPTSQYLYFNQSCGTCPSPLVSETQGTFRQRNFCWYPCMPWQWLYWDGTCQSSCVAPLWPEIQSTRQFCWYPCPTSQFLYWNGTCSSQCPEPLSSRFENSQWFCDHPCLATEFLYWNGSCINSCSALLIQEIQGNPIQKKFCWYPCPINQFRYWDNTCQTTCEFPLVPNIQGTPARKFCWYLCPTSHFLYWNGTCSSQCDPPFVQRTTNSRQFCDFPCSPSTQYIYWNTSCLSTCPFPLTAQVQGSDITRSFCWYPCQPSEWLYWNGTCLSSCPAPLVSENQGSPTRKFCWYTCQPSQYLYWNGSCIDTCPSPLTPEVQGTSHQRKFCWYSCPTTQFLYWNGTCLNNCPSPLSPETQGFRKFCWYSCPISQYVYWDQTCQDACPSPLWPEIQINRQFCWYPCAPSQFLYWNGTCSNQCDIPLSPRTANNQKFCDYPCLSNQYLYWNGSCINTCGIPLSPRTEGNPTRQFCDYLCQPTEFLYWDGTCLPTCDFPLTPNTQGTPSRNFCWYLCSSTDYLYWNGTCSSFCNYPLSKQLFKDFRFCNYACTGNKYLAPNGSCVDSCPSGHFQNTELYYCQACQDSLCSVCSLSLGAKCEVCKNQYILNTNQVCQDCQSISSLEITQDYDTYTYQYKIILLPSTCDLDETLMQQNFLPSAQSSLPKYSYQLDQTQDSYGNSYYLLKIQFNSSITSGGSLNFAFGSSLKTTVQVPQTPMPAQSADAGVKTTFAAVTGGTVGAGLTVGATSALWSIISFQQFMSYFVYMNFQLPNHVVYFLTMFDSASMETLPNPLASFTDRIADLWDSLVNNADPKYQLPGKFREYDTPTLFILNAGSTFLINMILVIVPYLFDFLRKFRDLGNQKFMIDIHSNLKWNIPIRVFLESGILLTFGTFIQIRKISFGNAAYAISSFCAAISFGYMCFMVNYILKTLIKFKPEDLKNPSIEMSIGTLFEGLVLKKENAPAKYYYLLVLFRGILLTFVIVFLDPFPIVQVAAMALFNLFFVFYVWKFIQFESRYVTWTSRIKEVLIMMVEVLFMTLISDYNTEHFRNIIGWIIICMLGLTLTMELLFAFYLQVLAVRTYMRRIRDLAKKIREYCKQRKQRKMKQQVRVRGIPTLAETSRKMIFIKT